MRTKKHRRQFLPSRHCWSKGRRRDKEAIHQKFTTILNFSAGTFQQKGIHSMRNVKSEVRRILSSPGLVVLVLPPAGGVRGQWAAAMAWITPSSLSPSLHTRPSQTLTTWERGAVPDGYLGALVKEYSPSFLKAKWPFINMFSCKVLTDWKREEGKFITC